MTDSVNHGEARLRALIDMMPMADPREDIDTVSLVRRFPHLSSVEIEEITIVGDAGSIPARRYRATSGGPGFVWVHGGAFISGDLTMPESHWVSMELASRGVSVLALDYRKALHGVHHPALSDDVLAGWIAAPEVLGVPRGRIHLGGASAGANLSAGVAARLKADDAALPSSLVLIYPVLHSELPAPSAQAAAALATLPDEARFTPDFMRAINVNYVGNSQHLTDPIAFAAHGNLNGMPRTLIINAEADDLRASGEAFAPLLAAAGVPVTMLSEPGTRHGYLDLPGDAAAIASIDRITAWLSAGEE